MNISVEKSDTGKPIIAGETNLPDQTKLMIGYEDEAWRKCDPEKPCLNGQHFYSSYTVVRGRFSTGPSPRTLNAGKYWATVLMPYSEHQPEEVQAVIGRHGERLKGRLVKKKSDGSLVEADHPFTVP
ncbi:hypothetical protein [Polyangium sp. 15x6]|uniref:hypothetical protein n=1 Tax=Polyangium sp. 15x6 TaxID=3042687 RepID=UPI00249CEC66|nr:hypothetical protein [Polyangium sp. 15x6]MDI3291968.1 hypothetical protein [Polyangium sp. 15x6]